MSKQKELMGDVSRRNIMKKQPTLKIKNLLQLDVLYEHPPTECNRINFDGHINSEANMRFYVPMTILSLQVHSIWKSHQVQV